MAQARRAKARPSRAILPLAVAAALLIGGSIAAWQFWPEAPTAAEPHQTPAVVATESTAVPPATPQATATPSTTTMPTAEPTTEPTPEATTEPANPSARRAMADCRDRVRAADRVLEAAEPGIAHWAAHVDAEGRAEAGKITADEQKNIFMRTRLAGPTDQQRYTKAINAHRKIKASCGKVEDADATIRTVMAKCQKRSKAQQPVLEAAADAMKDWKNHLADMQRSRQVHVQNAQVIWLKAYRAAPPHIKAYDKAVDRFDAPHC